MKVKLMGYEALSKKYPNSYRGSIMLPDDSTLWLPSEALSLNYQTGGGIPYGKIVELFGYESTGKSQLAKNFIKTAQALGGIGLWGDAEHAFMPGWAEQNGIDLSRIEVFEDNTIELYSDWTRDMILYHRSRLTNNEPIVLVTDSIAALECEDEIDSDDAGDKAKMGNRAKAIYKMYRKRQHFFHKMGVVVIMINQVRKRLGASMFENAETTPGGDSTRFYSSLRIGLTAGRQIKGKMTRNGFKEDNKGKKMGRTVYVQVHKNKVHPPKNSVKTEVYFLPDIWGYVGYSKYHGLPDILVEEGIVRKKGSYFYYKEHSICQGEDNFIAFLHEEAKKRKLILKHSFINTVSKTREKLASLDRNLFKVTAKKMKDDE